MVDRKITGLEVAGSSPVTITFYHPLNNMDEQTLSQPHILTISEFRFRPNPRHTLSLQLTLTSPHPQATLQSHHQHQALSSRTLDCRRRQTSCKSVRVPKPQREPVLLLDEQTTDPKPSMFLAWPQRCSSSRKGHPVSSRTVQQVLHSTHMARSQRRLPHIEHEQIRTKGQQITPHQLIARKLQWQGKGKTPISMEKGVRVRRVGAVRGREEGGRGVLTGWEKHGREYTDQFQF